MYGELHGKVAVVTGAATGLGLFITLRYILEGMNVVADYVGELPKEFEDVQAKHADRVKFVKADVSNEEDIKALAETALKEFGHVDIWVNNAGVEASFPTIDMPLKEWQRVIDVNLNGVFLGSRESLRIFIDQKIKGSIINMSSVHQTIALEYAEYGIRANCIAPGAINTPINAEKFSDPEQLKQTTSMVPMGIIGKPNQVAAAAAWLASDESSYVTGTTLFVDGGMSLYPSFQHGAG